MHSQQHTSGKKQDSRASAYNVVSDMHHPLISNNRPEAIIQQELQEIADQHVQQILIPEQPAQLKKGAKAKAARRAARKAAKGKAYREKMKQRIEGRRLARVPEAVDEEEEEEPDEEKLAWDKTLQVNSHMVKEGYTPVRIRVPGAEYDGLTTFNDRKMEMQVRFNPERDEESDEENDEEEEGNEVSGHEESKSGSGSEENEEESSDERIGRLAATFTHEIAVHGGDGDPDDEHKEMFMPEHRDVYLSASHRTFMTLDNAEQQESFADTWRKDMLNQIEWAEEEEEHEEDEEEKKEEVEEESPEAWVEAQHAEMIAAITDPGSYAWAVDGFVQAIADENPFAVLADFDDDDKDHDEEVHEEEGEEKE